MAVLQGRGQNLLSPCVCYPKDPCGIGLNLCCKPPILFELQTEKKQFASNFTEHG